METKEEDIVEDLFVASTHSYLLFFTNLGKVHWLKVHEIPEGGAPGQGQGHGEPPVAGRGRAGGHLRARARLRRRRLRPLRHPPGQGEEDRARGLLASAGRRHPGHRPRRGRPGHDGPAHRRPARGHDRHQARHDHPLRGGRGRARWAAAPPACAASSSRTTTRSSPPTSSRRACRSSPSPSAGYGKRTPLEEYRLQGRAGKGIIDIKTGGRNGNVVGMLQVRDGRRHPASSPPRARSSASTPTTSPRRAATPWACASSTSRPTTGWARSPASTPSSRPGRSHLAGRARPRLIREQPEAVARALADKGGAETWSRRSSPSTPSAAA